jgi:hypothetical protein
MIPHLKNIEPSELIELLGQCACLLDNAYQETLNKDFWMTSERIKSFQEILRYQFSCLSGEIVFH